MTAAGDFSQLLADNLRLQEAIHQAQIGAAGADARALADSMRQAFVVDGMRLLIRYDEGSELTEPLAIAMLPGLPPWFLGVCNLHGLLTPVFDLAAYLGLPPKREARRVKRMLLVLGHGAEAAAIYIDGLPKNFYLRKAQSESSPAPAPSDLQAHIRGVYSLRDNSWWDLDVASLLAAIEAQLQQAQAV